jgi:hypothetical protein
MKPTLQRLSSILACLLSLGRNLTQEKMRRREILPLVVNRFVELKRPYLHYRANAA